MGRVAKFELKFCPKFLGKVKNFHFTMFTHLKVLSDQKNQNRPTPPMASRGALSNYPLYTIPYRYASCPMGRHEGWYGFCKEYYQKLFKIKANIFKSHLKSLVNEGTDNKTRKRA